MAHVDYATKERVATITLTRADKANAQNEQMLDELHECFLRAEADDDVRVIVLRAEGKHLSLVWLTTACHGWNTSFRRQDEERLQSMLNTLKHVHIPG